TGSSKGTKSQPKSSGKSVQLEEPEFEVTDSDMLQDQEENLGNDDVEPKEKTPQQGQNQSWLMTLASSAEKLLKSFDELMSTPIDFSAFIMNGLKINNLTQETLLGPAFRLLKGTRSNYAELEYDFEECYKALLEKLDWENPEGGDYPFDLTKPLPLVMSRNHQKVPVDYFFNNDLKYLQGGISTMTYTTSLTKIKAAQYDLPGIKDMVPNIWVPVKVAYDKPALWGISHWREQHKVLIAYESGLIILWDLLEGQVAVVRGDKVLELKDGVVDSPSQDGRLSDGQNLEDKEITILCWALSNGTVVAVGYLDGDIMMQLSSAERKLPVIVLHWSPNSKSQNDYDVQLFVYGGDEIGSEEVAVLDMNAFSVSFLTDSLPNPGSLVISMTWKSFVYNGGDVKSPKGARPKDLDKPVDKLMFVCTKDATLYVYDGYDYRTLNYKPVQLKKDTTAISIVVSWIISGPVRKFYQWDDMLYSCLIEYPRHSALTAWM
ncbi:reverse transcriptase domain-containing protein, partial [Tanacetum coccineum]